MWTIVEFFLESMMYSLITCKVGKPRPSFPRFYVFSETELPTLYNYFCWTIQQGELGRNLYSEFIWEVDLFHKQKLAQSTNYAKTCCVYKGEINLTLLREEPKSIFFSVNFSCFRFFISAGDFTCYGGMLWAGGYYSSSALHRPCPSPSQELSHRGRVLRQCQSRQRQPRARSTTCVCPQNNNKRRR